MTALMTVAAASCLPTLANARTDNPSPGVYLATFASNSSLYRLNPQTHSVDAVGQAGAQLTDIAFRGDTLFAVGFGSFYRISLATGVAQYIGSLGVSGANALVSQPGADVLFGATVSGGLFEIDPSSGETTVIGDFGSGLGSSGDLAFLDGRLYATVTQSGHPDALLATIDLVTGRASLLGDTGFRDVYGLSAGSGFLYGATYSGDFISISPATGRGQLLWREGIPAGGLASFFPEPDPLVVLIGGLGSKIPASGGDWTFVKQRLEKAGYKGRVFVAKTHPGLPASDSSDVIDSNSADWGDSAERLDHQLVQAGLSGRPIILVGHSMGGLIARVYAQIWEGLQSGCQPLGMVQLGTPNKGSEAASLRGLVPASDATRQLGDAAVMAAFNADFPNAEGLPIYRIAGSFFPKGAVGFGTLRPDLTVIFNAISAVYGKAANDSVVTVDSVRGGPTAGWQGCTVFKALHANSKWLSTFRDKAGCVLPRRSGKKGAAAIDELIMEQIIRDVRGVEKSASAAMTLPSWVEASVLAPIAGPAH